MKSLYMLSTKLRVYLIELPLFVILTFAIHYNDQSEDLLKFYPLIAVLILGIIFIDVYFFRGVSLSHEEIRTFGPFAAKDNAILKKDKVLVITLRPGRKINLSVWGNDGTPAFDWQTEQEAAEGILRQFSCKVIGGQRLAKRILKFFTVSPEALCTLVENDGESYENDCVLVTTERKNELFEISVKLKTDFDEEPQDEEYSED